MVRPHSPGPALARLSICFIARKQETKVLRVREDRRPPEGSAVVSYRGTGRLRITRLARDARNHRIRVAFSGSVIAGRPARLRNIDPHMALHPAEMLQYL